MIFPNSFYPDRIWILNISWISRVHLHCTMHVHVCISLTYTVTLKWSLTTYSCLQQDYAAIMIAMLRQMTDTHYSLYLQNIPESEMAVTFQNLADFLTEIICVFKDLITSCVFPADWNEMIMVQNQVFLKVKNWKIGLIWLKTAIVLFCKTPELSILKMVSTFRYRINLDVQCTWCTNCHHE